MPTIYRGIFGSKGKQVENWISTLPQLIRLENIITAKVYFIFSMFNQSKGTAVDGTIFAMLVL